MDCGFLFSNPDETSSENDFNFDDDATTIIHVENSKTPQHEENRKKVLLEKEKKGTRFSFSGKKKEQRERIEISEHTNITLSNKGFRLLSLDEWMYVARCNRKFYLFWLQFFTSCCLDTRKFTANAECQKVIS